MIAIDRNLQLVSHHLLPSSYVNLCCFCGGESCLSCLNTKTPLPAFWILIHCHLRNDPYRGRSFKHSHAPNPVKAILRQ